MMSFLVIGKLALWTLGKRALIAPCVVVAFCARELEIRLDQSFDLKEVTGLFVVAGNPVAFAFDTLVVATRTWEVS
jgi:hypothetical protein